MSAQVSDHEVTLFLHRNILPRITSEGNLLKRVTKGDQKQSSYKLHERQFGEFYSGI